MELSATNELSTRVVEFFFDCIYFLLTYLKNKKKPVELVCYPFQHLLRIKILITTMASLVALISPRRTKDSVDSEPRGKSQTGYEIYKYCQLNLGC